MNQIKRSLPGVLLALALVVPCAAVVQAEPATDSHASWLTSVLDLLGGFLDGLWSVDAASETGDDPQVLELDGDEATPTLPTWDPEDGTTSGETSNRVVGSFDPNG